MRPYPARRVVWLLAACLWAPFPLTRAAAADPPSATADDPEALLQRALDCERQHKWTAAIELYEGALQQWPERTEFKHRLRLCEIHSKLARRYGDKSFKGVLLRLPREKVFDLYDEILERIETHYVEAVSIEPLLRRGYDNLEVALRETDFLKVNAPAADRQRVEWLRDAFRARRAGLDADGRDDAHAEVVAACELAQKALGLGPAAVVLEFAFGACDALPDDYSSYLTPDKLDDLFAMIDGSFVGLGVELKADEQGLKLVGIIRGGPASEAGLKVGDRITHVGPQSLRGLTLDEAASKLQGNEGTPIQVRVLRANGQVQDLRLVRRAVEVKSVAQAHLVDEADGVGYIQLIGFQKSSTEELSRAIAALERQGMRHLILDLRGNPGGLLNVSVEIAERFLDGGTIVSTRGRAPGQSSTYAAHQAAVWRMPMSVLIDHDSASASEILAGALKDHRRATIVGQRSYGKGSVQSIFPLRNAPAGLKLTTARFYSPRNHPYSEQGVEPDVPIIVQYTARPNGNEPPPPPEFGDPARDPVLGEAVRQARRQLSKAG